MELKINNYEDRNKTIIALINAGYKVTLTEKPRSDTSLSVDYYINIDSSNNIAFDTSFNNVNRVEIIDDNGRVFSNNTYTNHDISMMFQDNGKTLKILIKERLS